MMYFLKKLWLFKRKCITLLDNPSVTMAMLALEIQLGFQILFVVTPSENMHRWNIQARNQR